MIRLQKIVGKKSQTALEIIHVVGFMTFLFFIIFLLSWKYHTENEAYKEELAVLKECESLRSLTAALATMDKGTLVPYDVLYNISLFNASRMVFISSAGYRNSPFECLLPFAIDMTDVTVAPRHSQILLSPTEKGIAVREAPS